MLSFDGEPEPELKPFLEQQLVDKTASMHPPSSEGPKGWHTVKLLTRTVAFVGLCRL